MTSPLFAADSLPPDAWESLRLRTIFECCKWDIQSEDHCVLADHPLVLEEDDWRVLAVLAESLTSELLAAERELLCRPGLHRALGLPTEIRRALRVGSRERPSGSTRVMRFDFHLTTDGWRLSEVNTDVPGGFIEASGFAALMAEHYPGYTAPPSPAAAYVDRIAAAVSDGDVVALVHATAHCDDRQVMQYLAQELRGRRIRTLLLAPDHLKWESGLARVTSSFATATPALLVRFFPAEWLPNVRPASTWEPWFRGGRTPMSNPGCAILTQSKRFPLVWKELNTPLPAWRSWLPETRCPGALTTDSREWVFKPALGRVGEGVAIAGVTERREFDEVAGEAKRHPDQWVAQRRFEAVALPTSGGARYACLGLFTVDGRAAGTYGRIASKPLIDQDAQDIAVLIGR